MIAAMIQRRRERSSGDRREDDRLVGAALGGLERRRHLRGRLEPLGRVLRQRLEHDRVERRAHLRVDRARYRRLLADLLHRDRDGVVAVERDAPAEHLEEDDPDRVDVGRRRDLHPLRLLGAEVLGGAHHRAGPGDLGAAGAGDAEVGDPDPPVAVDQDVHRLQVAVDDPVLVRERGGGEHLARHLDRLLDLEPLVDQLAQRGALDQLHRDVVAVLVGAAVEDADDVLVLQPRRRRRLAAEPLDELGVAGEVLVQELERDVAAELGVAGAPDVGHAAGAEPALQPVAAVDRDSGFELHPLFSSLVHDGGGDRAGDRRRRSSPAQGSVVTAIAICGSSTGAKAMNQGWAMSFSMLISAVPVLPANVVAAEVTDETGGGSLVDDAGHHVGQLRRRSPR